MVFDGFWWFLCVFAWYCGVFGAHGWAGGLSISIDIIFGLPAPRKTFSRQQGHPWIFYCARDRSSYFHWSSGVVVFHTGRGEQSQQETGTGKQ